MYMHYENRIIGFANLKKTENTNEYRKYSYNHSLIGQILVTTHWFAISCVFSAFSCITRVRFVLHSINSTAIPI